MSFMIFTFVATKLFFVFMFSSAFTLILCPTASDETVPIFTSVIVTMGGGINEPTPESDASLYFSISTAYSAISLS